MNSSTLFRTLLKTPEKMVIAPGAFDGISARLIAEAGFEAIYMTGAGTAASRIGQPDLGLITLTEMVANAATIVECTGLPVIADADTGYGNPLNVMRTVREYERAGVAAIHLEDQTFPKRCGHMEGKHVVPAEEFVQKIRAACDARRNDDFVIIARTDARTVCGFEEAVRRGNLYADAGADVVFIESPLTVEEMSHIPKVIEAPCLINMAGPASRTPALPDEELKRMGYKVAIHPAISMDAVVTAIRRALQRLKEEGISWDPENIVGPHKFFEAMGLESWRACEKKFTAKGEESSMKTNLDRRTFLKATVGGAAAFGSSWLFSGNPLFAKDPYKLGDITITWAGVQPFYLPCAVAKEKGFFDQEGVNVGKIFTSKGGSDTVRNIMDGGLPLGECSADSAVMAIVKRDEPFKLVAGGAKSPGSVVWVVRPDSNLKKIQDLKGKTISFTTPGSVTEALAALILEAAPGIDPQDVKRIPAGGMGPGLTLLEKGEVDAAMCSYPTMLTQGAKYRILFYATDFVPDYFMSFWMAKESFLKTHGDVMRGFLRARTRGLEFILKNPEEAAQIFMKTSDSIKDIKAAMETLKHEGILDGKYYSDNRFIAKGLETVEKGMRVVGSIAPEAKVPWGKIIDQSYVDASKRINL